jgi:hypothetical protein
MFYSNAIEFVLRKKKAVAKNTAHSLEDTTYETQKTWLTALR